MSVTMQSAALVVLGFLLGIAFTFAIAAVWAATPATRRGQR